MWAVYRPCRELQKAAPRNFDAFFEPGYFEKQKKTVEIPSVRALTLYLVFCSAPFAIPGFSRAIPLLHVAIKPQKQRKEHAMTQAAQTLVIEMAEILELVEEWATGIDDEDSRIPLDLRQRAQAAIAKAKPPTA